MGIKPNSEEILKKIYNELKQKNPAIEIEMYLLMWDTFEDEPSKYKDSLYCEYDETTEKWLVIMEICDVTSDENNRLEFKWYF